MSTPIHHPLGPDGRPAGSPPVVAAPAVATAADDSAVSWAAILAGALAAAALSLILVMLGSGLGLSSVSPWAYEGVSAEALGWSAIGWISFTAVAASGLGGYLAGRLRRRWLSTPGDETYFRDTAHGFLSWALATLLTAAFLATSIATILGTGARAAGNLGAAGVAAAAAGAGAADAASEEDPASALLAYHVDVLLRADADAASGSPFPTRSPQPGDAQGLGATDDPSGSAAGGATAVDRPGRAGGPDRRTGPGPAERAEVVRILAQSLRSGSLDDGDAGYLARRIAQRTGVDEATARTRVDAVHGRLVGALDAAENEARELADEARKAAARASLWLFITLLMGAFSASLFATFGGRQRDL